MGWCDYRISACNTRNGPSRNKESSRVFYWLTNWIYDDGTWCSRSFKAICRWLHCRTFPPNLPCNVQSLFVHGSRFIIAHSRFQIHDRHGRTEETYKKDLYFHVGRRTGTYGGSFHHHRFLEQGCNLCGHIRIREYLGPSNICSSFDYSSNDYFLHYQDDRNGLLR